MAVTEKTESGRDVVEKRRFRAGETIIREGELGEAAYIMESGRVQVFHQSGDSEVELAVLGPGEIFGEMGMIDEKPRNATVRALEDTEVLEMHRDGFFEALKTTPDVSLTVLSMLLERLREADATILQLRGEHRPAQAAAPASCNVSLQGTTDEAVATLPDTFLHIDRFPFRIGRASEDPLVHNDLFILDEVPWQVSRHHVAIVCEDGRIGVRDRGSHLGSEVDGRRLGGPSGEIGTIFFQGNEGTLVLGNASSRYRYKVLIED